jgi:hypothetical protein
MLGRILLALGFAAAMLVGCFGEATITGQKSNVTAIAECIEDSDCPPAEDACGAPECSGQQCHLSPLPAGTPSSTQIAGDCLIAVCDGQGHTTKQSDGSDVVDDGNPCTLEGCSNEGPVAAEAPMGSVCGFKACCDPRGACTSGSCTSHEECATPPDAFCATAICNDCGQCELEVFAQGSTSMADVVGDCMVIKCDGSGNVYMEPDDADVPFDADGDLCTVETCEGGMPTAKAVDCPYPQTCYMGVCG